MYPNHFKRVVLLAFAALVEVRGYEIALRTPAIGGAAVHALTERGDSPVRIDILERSPQLLFVVAEDVLLPADYADARKLILDVFRAKHDRVEIQLGVLKHGGSMNFAGPFRNLAEVQTVLRKTTRANDAAPASDDVSFFAELAASLQSTPSAWGFTVVLGRIPSPPSAKDTELVNFSGAWLTSKFISQKRSLLFWNPGGASQGHLITLLSQQTGGAPCHTAADLIDLITTPEQLARLSWDPLTLSRGFEVQTSRITAFAAELTVQSIAAKTPASIPSIEKYAAMRESIRRAEALMAGSAADISAARQNIANALAINPSDAQATKLGIALAERAKDWPAEIALLETAVELSPRDRSLWAKLGDLEYREKNFEKGEPALMQAKELGVSSALLAEQLGQIRLEKQDFPHAMDSFQESLSLEPAQQQLWLQVADIAKHLDRVDEQIEALERALVLDGSFLARRTELIQLYLARHDSVSAARHVDLEMPRLPQQADTQVTWAQFYEQLERPSDALICWKRAAALDPKREYAHFAIASIFQKQSLWKEALQAADTGLENNGNSASLTLTKSVALEKLDLTYEARQTIDAFARASKDIDVLRRRAEMSDRFGGDAARAWREYGEVLVKSSGDAAVVAETLERGRRVAMREGDVESLEWFSGRLTGGKASPEVKPPADAGFWIAGGVDALALAARGKTGSNPERFLVDYCRSIIANSGKKDSNEAVLYRKGLASYFDRLGQLIAIGTRTGNRAVLTLSLANKQSQKQTESVLATLGWRLRIVKQKVSIESGEKRGEAQKQDLASALALDPDSMERSFNERKPFRIEIRFDWVPVALGAEMWRTALQTDKLPGGIAEAMSQNPSVARLYVGLSSVDTSTASVLIRDFGLANLISKYSDLLALYASALSIHDGRAVTPGGTSGEVAWTSLLGGRLAEPARFFRSLFEKDNGKALLWFFTLSQLDNAHQKFFTLSAARMANFYQAFKESDEVQDGVARLMRDGSFAEFLREIPLYGDSVDFPGSAEVWMVARGRSATPQRTQKLLKKVRKAVAPEVEDEILLRLAHLRNKSGSTHTSELDNFIAVTRIDQHRSEPLDEESALMLAQNFIEFGAIYPYFSDFRQLGSGEFARIFAFLASVRNIDEVLAEAKLNQFYSLLELIRLAQEFGGMAEDKATGLVSSLADKFTAPGDPAAVARAAFSVTTELIEAMPGLPSDADGALEMLSTGRSNAVQVEWDGAVFTFDHGRDRSVEYRRVLALQKIPSMAALLRMNEAVERIAAAKDAYAPLLAGLRKDFGALPVAEIGKDLKFQGHARRAFVQSDPAKMGRTMAALTQKTSQKKVNPGDVQKLCQQLLEELSAQVRIALGGVVYAAYMNADENLVANDPLLVRKHQAFELRPGTDKKARFQGSELKPASAGEGSFFFGGFGQFGSAAASASAYHREAAYAAIYAAQMAAIRRASWGRYTDRDQQLLGLKIRMAREWLVYATDDPALLAALAEDSTGILSLGRQRDLVRLIAAREWSAVWETVTFSDLMALADKYLERYAQSPWRSPVDLALRHALQLSNGASLRVLGSMPTALFGCNHPDLVSLGPYEEYERHLFPTEIAERSAEIKIYLANLLDRYAMPAALMPSIAEAVAKQAFETMRMSDERDWKSAIRSFAAIDGKSLGRAIEARKQGQ